MMQMVNLINQKKYKDLYNKYEELKVIRKNEIKGILKEVIFDKDI